jgi:putative ATP-dependent endonuclease of OLD family
MAAEALFASKIVLVEGESESLILPFCFDMIGYDYIGKGISIVRCGGKNEIDRFYRLYSEFGIPCYILFDGDSQNVGTSDEKHTIQANRNILGLFDINADYPDGYVHDNYLGFTRRLEDALNIGEISSNVKGLKLFIRFKQAIQEGNAVPQWVGLIAEKIDLLPEEAVSVLQNLETKNIIEDFEEIPF